MSLQSIEEDTQQMFTTPSSQLEKGQEKEALG